VIDMTVPGRNQAPASPLEAVDRLVDLGFLASPDLPDGPGPAYLLVALRDTPSLRHFDPETIGYWTGTSGRGARRELTRAHRMPFEDEVSWGTIQIVDRLHVSNEYLTFGGHVAAATLDGVVVAVFSSPAPILRRGGHSQPWDQGAESVGAFFGRLQVAIDYRPRFEGEATAADPLARYAAFLIDTGTRYRASPALRASQPELWVLFDTAERRLRIADPHVYSAGAVLLRHALVGPA
jgi:hypothetical protein